MYDALGNRMKSYEAQGGSGDMLDYANYPIYARIDGRGFSKFTKTANRPFDEDISNAMFAATVALVDKTHAAIGYFQSDEISLAWGDTGSSHRGIFFNGKRMKMVSVLAGIATAAFLSSLMKSPRWAERCHEYLPHFDARVISMPSRIETANMFLWRTMDASGNAVSMAAHHEFGHKATMHMSFDDKVQMLRGKGIEMADYPNRFSRGSFVRRIAECRTLSDAEWTAIPEEHRPERDAEVTRHKIVEIPLMGHFHDVVDRTEFIFG